MLDNMLDPWSVRLGAVARGSPGCLRSFPEVRKIVSHVSRAYLEVPWHMLFVATMVFGRS
jgi:hypothetical protein